ncbi:hypothetical protein KM043_001408 [Ampulex compressa]|nr:hypothetical protein KM043_001408 [Ampulex compressa]
MRTAAESIRLRLVHVRGLVDEEELCLGERIRGVAGGGEMENSAPLRLVDLKESRAGKPGGRNSPVWLTSFDSEFLGKARKDSGYDPWSSAEGASPLAPTFRDDAPILLGADWPTPRFEEFECLERSSDFRRREHRER